MRHAKEKPIRQQSAPAASRLARCVAPEDIEPGQFVTLLQVVCELPSFLWSADAATLPMDEPVRMELLPEPAGVPLKVEAVCLPFLLVRPPTGKARTLDVRRCRLARLSEPYVRAALKKRKKKRRRPDR